MKNTAIFDRKSTLSKVFQKDKAFGRIKSPTSYFNGVPFFMISARFSFLKGLPLLFSLSEGMRRSEFFRPDVR
ncbi:MAG: hypothetical protein PHS57_04265 [Alphaproteobacteria bacterium]|nr:hypothetical protein [Alphaproteobacteria bacterium]